MLRFILFLVLTVYSAHAANWYVEPSAQGKANGTDWSDAWSMANLNSNWSSVKGGDTVWLAGGTYGTGIQPSVNGTSSAPITVNRVQASDTAPSAAAGWNASFDSQVIIDANGPGVAYGSPNVGSYFVFNGRVHNGLRFYTRSSASSNSSGIPMGAIDFGYGSGGQTNISFYNCDVAGPCPVGNEGFTQPFFSAPVNVWTWNGSGYGGASNILLDHCDIHGGVVAISSQNWTNSSVQYCNLFDILDGSGVDHSNLIQINASGNITFRYNNVYNWQVEGFFFLGPSPSSAPNWYIYGNVFHDALNGAGYPRFIESQTGGSTGTIYVWNNTFADIGYMVFSSASKGTYASGSQCVNNIFWNCAGVFNNWQGSNSNNMYGGSTASFSGGINGGKTAPFKSYNDSGWTSNSSFAASNNFALANQVGPGTNLSANFTTDILGNLFSTTNWSMGAYSFNGTAGPTPTASASATPTPTPKPTTTPHPTATPSPIASATPSATPSIKFAIGNTVTPSALINVRQTPAGTVLGTQPVGTTGLITNGPQQALLNGIAVNWWAITYASGVSGWSGEDNLKLGVAPATPTPTPIPTYLKWEAKLNAAVAGGQAIGPWIAANPPTSD